MILLMTLAYSSAIFQGPELRKKQVQKYVSRRKEPKKKYRRRSTFGVGVDAEKWVDYLEQYAWEMQQLMKLTPSKRRFYGFFVTYYAKSIAKSVKSIEQICQNANQVLVRL